MHGSNSLGNNPLINIEIQNQGSDILSADQI